MDRAAVAAARAAPDEVAAALHSAFDELDTRERFVFVKLIGGGFRVGVSKLLVIRALAEHAQLDAKIIAQRMMGYTDKTARPEPMRYRALIARDDTSAVAAHPFPSSSRTAANSHSRSSSASSALRHTGRSNGSTTAFARSWSAATAAAGCGRAAGADRRPFPT
jgi:ATP-dependent DNA ligase